MPKQFDIDVCPSEQRADALRVLHDGLPSDQQSALVHALDAIRGEGEQVFDGLLVARADDDAIREVCWVQPLPGRTAVVWPPGDTGRTAAMLLEAVGSFLDHEDIVLAQLLVKPDGTANTSILQAAGFQELADLAYMTVDRGYFPSARPAAGVDFEPHAADHPVRLGELLMQTYEDSLDCPALNGIRNPADILAGYAAQGDFAPERWFLVQHRGEDVGVLLLATHASGENWELVYMGVVPAARGQGFGWQILQYALWQAGCGGAERLVLAVDETNQPALDTYRRAGLVIWDRRTVYARIGPRRSS